MMWVLLAAAFAGIIGCAFVGGLSMGKRIGLSTAPYCEPAPESALLSAAHERVRVRDVRIAVLESVQLVPADPLSLPWQVVPAPAEVSLLQALADEVQDLRAELAKSRAAWVKSDGTRQRHWNLIKKYRIRLAAMVPVAELEHVEELRTRSLSVARSAASRAADRAAVITEIEVARIEALSLDDFNEQFELILAEHGIEVTA